MKRILITICASLAFAGLATEASAEMKEPTKVRLDVPAPDDVEGSLKAETRKVIAEKVQSRIRKRLEAADVKFSNVTVRDDGVIVIEADPDHDAATVRGIAVPPGQFAVRVVRSIGTHWVEVSDKMPSGVELRAGEDALDRDSTYVWSESRQKLESFLKEVSVPDGDVAVFSTGGGWRSVTLGETLMTHEHVDSSEIRRVQTGAPFVAVEVSPEAKSNFEALTEPQGMQFAAVLDGEVVSLMDAGALSEHLLNIPAPEHLSGWTSLIGWARQVAGRLAATIPVQLVPLRE